MNINDYLPANSDRGSFPVDLEMGDMGLDLMELTKNFRICHLNLVSSSSGCGCGVAVALGCSCQDDLAVVHKQCAETWFKIEGNNGTLYRGQQSWRQSYWVHNITVPRHTHKELSWCNGISKVSRVHQHNNFIYHPTKDNFKSSYLERSLHKIF